MNHTDPTETARTLRDRITAVRRALAEADGFDFDSLEPHDYQRQAAAVVGVLAADTQTGVCICAHTEQQHFEDACLVCNCGDYLVPEAAREVIARWRAAAGKAERIRENADFHLGQEMARRQLAEKEADRLSADRAAVLLWAADHLAAMDPVEAALAGQHAWQEAAKELRRLAAEAQPQPATCRNCQGSGLDPRYNGEYACPDCSTEARQPDDVERRVYAWAQTIDTADGGHTVCIPGVHHSGNGPETTAVIVSREDVPVLAAMLAETQQPDTETPALPYTHTDDDADTLQIGTVMASTYDGEAPVVFLNVQQYQGDDQATVYVRPERVEEVVTALRAAGRAAAPAAAGPGRAADTQDDEDGGRG